nr:MAG TPA: hypothetical protein [Caudoviricetes sp.]
MGGNIGVSNLRRTRDTTQNRQDYFHFFSYKFYQRVLPRERRGTHKVDNITIGRGWRGTAGAVGVSLLHRHPTCTRRRESPPRTATPVLK